VATYFDDCSSLGTWVEGGFAASTQFTQSGSIISASSTSALEALELSAVSSDADRDDAEILVKFRTSSLISTAYRACAVRIQGVNTHYNACYRSGTTGIRIRQGNVEIGSITITLSASTWYWIRLRVNGSDVKVSVWADGGSESGWGYEGTNSVVTGVGDVGIWNHANGGVFDVDTVGVGTNGDTAPSSAGGGYTHPTLSAVTATEITATSFKPRVTYEF
jgi:hypothetical protein